MAPNNRSQLIALAITAHKSMVVTTGISRVSARHQKRPATQSKITMTSALLLLLIVTSAATVRASSSESSDSASGEVGLLYVAFDFFFNSWHFHTFVLSVSFAGLL